MYFTEENCKTPLPASVAAVSVLHYYARWSLPCRRQYLVLRQLQNDYRQALKILAVDVEDFSRIAEAHTIHSIPTITVFSRGGERRRLVGLQSLEALRRVIAEVTETGDILKKTYFTTKISSPTPIQEYLHE